jgi:hypothetical protein
MWCEEKQFIVSGAASYCLNNRFDDCASDNKVWIAKRASSSPWCCSEIRVYQCVCVRGTNMSYILAGVKYCKLKRSMERRCRTYFDRNASLGSRVQTHIHYYFHLFFLRLVMIGKNRHS